MNITLTIIDNSVLCTRHGNKTFNFTLSFEPLDIQIYVLRQYYNYSHLKSLCLKLWWSGETQKLNGHWTGNKTTSVFLLSTNFNTYFDYSVP